MVTIRHLQKGDTCILEVEGVLDIFTVEELDAALLMVKEVRHLLIDLSRLSFLDSTGIGAILRAIYLGQDQGFTVELSGMNKEIKELLETVGVLRVLDALQKGEK